MSFQVVMKCSLLYCTPPSAKSGSLFDWLIALIKGKRRRWWGGVGLCLFSVSSCPHTYWIPLNKNETAHRNSSRACFVFLSVRKTVRYEAIYAVTETRRAPPPNRKKMYEVCDECEGVWPGEVWGVVLLLVVFFYFWLNICTLQRASLSASSPLAPCWLTASKGHPKWRLKSLPCKKKHMKYIHIYKSTEKSVRSRDGEIWETQKAFFFLGGGWERLRDTKLKWESRKDRGG